MDWGKVFVVDDIKSKYTRSIFDEFTCHENSYNTLLLNDIFTIKCGKLYLSVSLYLQPIMYIQDLQSHKQFITMTELKKHMGWIYREGTPISLQIIHDTIQAFKQHMSENPSFSDVITLPLECSAAIEARGNSDWQGATTYPPYYRVVGATYKREY